MTARTTSSLRTAARTAVTMLGEGADLIGVWRHVVLQFLDDYESARRHLGAAEALSLMTDAPDPTGEDRVDAALAALAEHLARRDGEVVPAWANEPERATERWWFVAGLPGLHPRALVESPLSFRKRGVFITSVALDRV